MKVQKTTFEVEGVQEPCFIVSSDDDFVQVRISTCYHYIGGNTIYVEEFLDGELNSKEEYSSFRGITAMLKSDAVRVAKEFSSYLRE